jgi:hypothetical protein
LLARGFSEEIPTAADNVNAMRAYNIFLFLKSIAPLLGGVRVCGICGYFSFSNDSLGMQLDEFIICFFRIKCDMCMMEINSAMSLERWDIFM